MRILFVSGFGHLPQIYGGVMSNTHEMALDLTHRGHEVAVMAKLFGDDRIGLQTRLLGKLLPPGKTYDKGLGYRTYRRWQVLQSLKQMVEDFRPDVAIVQPCDHIMAACALAELSVPVVVYFHDVLVDRLDGDPRAISPAAFVTNSDFTRDFYRERFGIDSAVIVPLFRSEIYRTPTSRRNVTFINPQTLKGADVALEMVARLPEIPFCFVESWELPKDQEAMLRQKMQTHPNLSPRKATLNMHQIYGEAKVVLMPSRVEEAWGRVVSEAQFSGIPALASNRGGLPEAVGPGGIVLDPDALAQDWADALRRLWYDEAYYDEISAKALAYSQRPQINPDHQIDLLLEVAEAAARGENLAAEAGASERQSNPDKWQRRSRRRMDLKCFAGF